MTETIRVAARELTASEILDLLDAGKRVIIEVSMAGIGLDMSIRHQSGTYYCDTPMKLLTYETDEGMRTCLERYRLAKRENG
jgi:hypothetical protein